MFKTSIRAGLACWVAFATFSCSGEPIPENTATGGTVGQGGTSSGGATTNGGTTTGGIANTSGGAPGTTGGVTNTGGVPNTTGGVTSTGGVPNTTGGVTNTGGATSTGGAASGGAPVAGATGNGGATSGGASTGGSGSAGSPGKFSFFVTSIAAMRELSKSQDGFGGDLRFGETTGLAGADKICRTIAEKSMPGAGQKTWRAFLSTIGYDGQPQVNAIDRIGAGPWYDRLGRLVASTKTTILNTRPNDADAAIKQDLPNENGIPNHTDGAPGCSGNACPDNHDVLTGTGPMGTLYSKNNYNTCNDWTSAAGQPGMPGGGGSGGAGSGTGGTTSTGGRGGGFPQAKGPWCGHSWPRQGSGENWMSALAEGGCAPGVNLAEMGGPQQGVYTVGTGGGYGAIYCFALSP